MNIPERVSSIPYACTRSSDAKVSADNLMISDNSKFRSWTLEPDHAALFTDDGHVFFLEVLWIVKTFFLACVLDFAVWIDRSSLVFLSTLAISLGTLYSTNTPPIRSRSSLSWAIVPRHCEDTESIPRSESMTFGGKPGEWRPTISPRSLSVSSVRKFAPMSRAR
jgi:hypothetical protein